MSQQTSKEAGRLLCRQCGRPLDGDDIAIYRKLVTRDAITFLCRSCLAGYFGVSEQIIDEKIEQFRRQGCTLFPPEKKTT